MCNTYFFSLYNLRFIFFISRALLSGSKSSINLPGFTNANMRNCLACFAWYKVKHKLNHDVGEQYQLSSQEKVWMKQEELCTFSSSDISSLSSFSSCAWICEFSDCRRDWKCKQRHINLYTNSYCEYNSHWKHGHINYLTVFFPSS